MSKLLFIHIPKTSGTTLKLFFKDVLPDFYIQANSAHQVEQGDPLVGRVKDLGDIRRVLETHGGLALHVDSSFDEVRATTDFRSLAWYLFEPENVQYFRQFVILTMLREPFRRFLSEYAFLCRMKDAGPGFLPDLELTSIDAYMDFVHPNPTLHFLLEPRMHLRREITPEDLERVKHCVESYPIHVGIHERHAESIEYFGHVLGRDLTQLELPAFNVGSVPQHDPDLEAAFRERNRLELELYEFACRRFDSRRQAMARLGYAAS